jgi:hypothetical protein
MKNSSVGNSLRSPWGPIDDDDDEDDDEDDGEIASMIESIRVLDSTVSGAVDELSEGACRAARDLTLHTAAHSERNTTELNIDSMFVRRSPALAFRSHQENGDEVLVPLRAGVVVGRTATPHLQSLLKVSRLALFVERVDRALRQVTVRNAQTSSKLVVERAGVVSLVAMGASVTLLEGDRLTLGSENVGAANAPSVLLLVALRNETAPPSDDDEDDDADVAAVPTLHDEQLHRRKRHRANAATLPASASAVPAAQSLDFGARRTTHNPSDDDNNNSNNNNNGDDLSRRADCDSLQDALENASFATLTLDADPEDDMAPSFAAASLAGGSAMCARAEPLRFIDNEQLVVCGKRAMLSGSFGRARVLAGAVDLNGSPAVTLAIDCSVCGSAWCGHVARLLQRVALSQVSATLSATMLGFLRGEPSRRRKTPQLSNKAMQPIFDQIFGEFDETIDDTALSEVARFLDGDFRSSASVRRVGPIELDYVQRGWRRVDRGDEALVADNGADVVPRFIVSQAFVRGATSFYVLQHASAEAGGVVRCAISRALGPSPVFACRCECRSPVLCAHVCRILAHKDVPAPVDIGELLHSLARMSLDEQCGLAARIVMRAKALSVDGLLAVPLNRLANARATVSLNTAALPTWSVADPGAMPTVLMVSQDAAGDILVATLLRSYTAASLRLRDERLVASHCDSGMCRAQPCEHAVEAFRDFTFYARGGWGGVAVHAQTTIGGAAHEQRPLAPTMLSYDELVRTLRDLGAPERCTLIGMALRDAQQIRSSKVTSRFAQLFANVQHVDSTYPAREVIAWARQHREPLFSIEEFQQVLQRTQLVCSQAAFVDSLCAATLLYPQREHEQIWTTLWEDVVKHGDAAIVHQCLHAGRVLAPRPLSARIMRAAMSRMSQRSHMIEPAARRRFFEALCAPASADSSDAIERAAQDLFAVPDHVRARAPFELAQRLPACDPLDAARDGITPLLESAMFLLPKASVAVLQNAAALRRELSAVRQPHVPERVMSDQLSLADCAALAEARQSVLSPAYEKFEYANMVDGWHSDGGVLPVLLLCDAALRHPLVQSPFVATLLREAFSQLMAQLHVVLEGALRNEADAGSLRCLPPLAALAVDAMVASMSDVRHYSGGELLSIIQSTPPPLRKTLALRVVIERLGQSPLSVLRACFMPMFEWLAAHKLHTHQWHLSRVAMQLLAREPEEARFRAQVETFALQALKHAYAVDRRPISRAVIRGAIALYGPSTMEIVCDIGQRAMLLDHLLATPERWSELSRLLEHCEDDDARATLLDADVQERLKFLLVVAHAGTVPPAPFLVRVCDLLLDDNNAGYAKLLVRAPDATDAQRSAALAMLLTQTPDDSDMFDELCKLSRESFVLLSQARVCESLGRSRLAAMLLFGVYEDQLGIAENVQMQFEHEVVALVEKLLAHDDVDVIDLFVERRAHKLLQWIVAERKNMLIDAHARSTSGARRAFAVECFTCSVDNARALMQKTCRNARCNSCGVCAKAIEGLRIMLMWAIAADRLWEFDRQRTSLVNDLKAFGKTKLVTVANGVRLEPALTE